MKYLFYILFLFNSIILFSKDINLTLEEKKFLAENQPLRLHNEMNWPPYNFNVDGIPKGFSIDYMNLIAKKLDIEVKYISNKTWDEFMEMLKNNEIDAIINISKNKERSQFFDFTSVFHTAANAIYVQNGNEHIDTLKKLEGKTIVMPKGFFAQQLLETYYPNIKQILVKDSLEALRLLSLGKADATVGKKNVLDYIIATNNISGVMSTNYVDDSRLVSLIRVATSKNKPLLNSILEKAQKSVTDEEILDLKRKWFGGDDFKKHDNFLNAKEKIYLKNKSVIKMCNLYDLKPIEFYEDDEVKGITVDIIKNIERKIDIRFESIKVDTLNEAKIYLKQGICDILTNVTKINDLIDISNFTKPILSYKLAIVTQKGKPIVESLDEVVNKPMAKNRSSDLIKLLKSNYPDLNIIETKSDYDTFEAVNSNKVYFAIEPLPVVSYYMSKYALNNIFISRYTNMYFSSSIAVSNNEPILLDILNKAFDEIDENEHAKIFNKWTNLSLNDKFDYALLWKILSVVAFIMAILGYRQFILNKHNKKLQLANNKIEEKTIQLAKQKELFEKLYSKSSDGVLLIKNERILDSNEASLKIFSCYKNELFDKKLSDLSPTFQPDNTYSNEKEKEMFLNALNHGTNSFEWVYANKYKSGWIEVVLTAIEIDNEPVIHAVIRDINDRKKLEKELALLNNELESRIEEEIKKNQEKTTQLIQQSRLAQMGEMISMIAHQWRQPLTAISATTNNLLLKSIIEGNIDKKTLENELELINDYSQHLSSTIDDFRNFFKTDKIKIKCYLEELIDKSLNIIKTSFESKNIKLSLEYNLNQPLLIYSTEIQQVILNILKNAEDALIYKNEIENRIVTIKTYQNKNNAIVEICDNAGGIPIEIIDKVFDPYFTTKKSKEGSGLGLYMSKTIINEHCKGNLTVNNINNGALFKIEIPIT